MLKGFLRIVITIFILALIGFGVFDYLQNVDPNECSMTYMFQNPSLIPVRLAKNVEERFINYKLYLYCEGNDCPANENLQFTKPGSIPVLFVTGNADSHKQVRSLASVGIDKSRNLRRLKKNIKFLYFTVSFNEELSALYGPIMTKQTEFIRICVEHILSLFENVNPANKRPKTVLMIGNSMGGVVSRAILVPTNSNDNFHKKNLVHTIITQASPHNRPVINIDQPMSMFYEKINSFWLNKSENSLNNVVLASLYGGTRDIFVRTGLANVDKWKIESKATIISSHTQSIPYVWRSVDHRCMAWCRELVLVINRALFELVDPVTEQIVEDKTKRETVLRYYLEHDYKSEKTERDIIFSDITPKKLEIAENFHQMNFELNDFVFQDKLLLFNLKTHLETDNHDSLFIYTNLNAPNSFVLCKDFRTVATNEYKCTEAKDLFENYGRSMPPLFEGGHKSTIKTLNIDNLANLIKNEDYSYMVTNIPIHKKSSQSHQLIVKFDWYLQKNRETNLEMPSFKNHLQTLEVKNEAANVVYRRYYLPTFKNVLQAYQLYKIENPCDEYLKEEMLEKKNVAHKPLSSSTVMIQFNEPNLDSSNPHTFNSQAVQTKNKIIDLKLSRNQPENSMPYIDVINFDIKHILHHTSETKNGLNRVQANKCKATFNIEIAYSAVFGQIIRFFFVASPAFVVAVIQFYDFLTLKLKLNDFEFKSYFFLHKVQTFYAYHFMHSLIFNIVVYIFSSEALSEVINLVDPGRMFIPLNDFELLRIEGNFHPLIGFILYWCAYSIISVASFFLSIIFNILSVFLQKIILKIFGFFEDLLVQKTVSFLHLMATISMGIYSTALTHCGLFYGEILRMASENPVYSFKRSHVQFCLEQSRLLLIYLLLILNIPSVIVWTKSLQTNQIVPLFKIMPDCGFPVAVSSIVLHQIRFFKNHFNFTIFDMKNELLALFVLINSFLTVLYSAFSLYRVQYFILFHLFLMTFNSVKSTKKEEKNPPSQADIHFNKQFKRLKKDN